MVDPSQRAVTQGNRAENLMYFLILFAVLHLLNARDAWNVIGSADAAAASEVFFDGGRGLVILIFVVFALIAPFVLYPIWMFIALRNARRSGGDAVPAPGTALLHHILPPFFLYVPHQIVLALQTHAAARHGKTPNGVQTLLATLWWGTFWLAIILEVFRRTYIENGVATDMMFFNLTLAVSLLAAISALSLAWIVHEVSEGTSI